MSKFFEDQNSTPSFAARPADPALEQRIAKLVEFAQKNGPPFVDMIRQKQSKNPEYSFLSNGPGAQYFTWKLYCLLFNLDAGTLCTRISFAEARSSPHLPCCLQAGLQRDKGCLADQPLQLHPGQAAPHQREQGLGDKPELDHVASTSVNQLQQSLQHSVDSLPLHVEEELSAVLAKLTGSRVRLLPKHMVVW